MGRIFQSHPESRAGMLTPDQKLAKIGDICAHPGAFHWTGRQMANVIAGVLAEEEPIPYILSDDDQPIPYTVASHVSGRSTAQCEKGHTCPVLRPSNYTGKAEYPPDCPSCH